MGASIKPQWIDAMKYDHALLQKEMDTPDLDFSAWIDDSYLKKAYAASNLDYDQMQQTVVSPAPRAPGRKPAEIWFADKGVVAYDSTADMLAAESKAKADGSAISATYVERKSAAEGKSGTVRVDLGG